MTLAPHVLWTKYIAERSVQGLAENTIEAYNTGWNSFCSHARAMSWRLKTAEDFTFDRLVEWQASLKEVGKKDWTRRTYLMALKGFSRWLNQNGHAKNDPGARFQTPRLKRVLPVLPPFEMLAAQLAAEPSPRNRAIIAMGLYGGLRAGEIANLKRCNFIPGEGGLIGFVGKGGKQRSVALPHVAANIIAAYLQHSIARDHDPLIRKEDGSGAGVSSHVIHRSVTRWTRRHLGVRLTPHRLRHVYGKGCVDRGVDIRVIAEALGHESLESTRIYTQVSFERTRQIAQLFDSPGDQIIRRENSRKIKPLTKA